MSALPFLADAEECDEIIALAQPHLERSGVSNAETGAGGLSDIRTSHGKDALPSFALRAAGQVLLRLNAFDKHGRYQSEMLCLHLSPCVSSKAAWTCVCCVTIHACT